MPRPTKFDALVYARDRIWPTSAEQLVTVWEVTAAYGLGVDDTRDARDARIALDVRDFLREQHQFWLRTRIGAEPIKEEFLPRFGYYPGGKFPDGIRQWPVGAVLTILRRRAMIK
jgi:hypothetical protein